MNEISVSDRKSTNNIAEFSTKDEKNYIVNVRKFFFFFLHEICIYECTFYI